jgi:hypothetical protein
MSLSNLKKQRHIVGVEFKNHQELQGWCSSINSLRKTEENGKGSIFSVRGVMGFGFHLTGNYLYIVQSDEKPPPHKSPFFHFPTVLWQTSYNQQGSRGKS